MHESVDAFREEYRRTEIPAGYSGWVHFTITFGTCGAAIIFCALQIGDVRWWEWLTIPVTFFYSNITEHFGHRKPMHHLTRGLGLLFRRHTKQHHRFFTHERMELRDTRDYRVVLFPPILLLFFFGGFALPVGLLITWLSTANIAYLFVITSVGYFLNYEFLHWAYHQLDSSWVNRIPGMRVLRLLHTRHHNPELMSNYNFNITYPIADVLYGTFYRPPAQGTNKAVLRPTAK